jgi:hypothetical protein
MGKRAFSNSSAAKIPLQLRFAQPRSLATAVGDL